MLVSMSQARKLTLFHMRNNTPTMLLGPRGIGKTQMMASCVQDYAQEIGQPVRMLTTVLSSYDAFDIRGLGVPDLGKRVTTWLAPDWLPTVNNIGEEHVVWFWDEITNIQPDMERVTMQLAQDRCISGEKLGPNVRIVAAGNRRQDSKVARSLSYPLLNRFAIFEVDVDAAAWRAVMELRGRHPALIAFHASFPQLLLVEPKEGEYASASPRSVEEIDKPLKAGVSGDMLRMIVASHCCDDYAMAFMSYLPMWQNLPSTSAAIADPDNCKLPNRGDLNYAMAVALARVVTETTFSAAIKYAGRMGVEYRALMIEDALTREPTLSECKAYTDYAVAIARTGFAA
jgi:hypothetical protein